MELGVEMMRGIHTSLQLAGNQGAPPPRPGAAPEATPRAGPGAVVCDGAESGHNLELGLPQL